MPNQSALGSRTQRLFIVFLLGFSSGLPFALVTSTLQAWFAHSGMPILTTGMLSLLGLPYVYRLLWGPIVDRLSLLRLGKRRSWIFLMQTVLFIGFNVLSMLSPIEFPSLMIAIALLLSIFSATQDIAIDAHRIEYLPVSEHGLGATVAILGYRLALFIGGGLALLLAYHSGWAMAYRSMSFFLIPGILATLFSQEPNHPTMPCNSYLETFIAPLRELMKRQQIMAVLCFIFFFKLGEAFTATNSGIVMPFLIQGLGFPLDVIAYTNKILGIASILIGGVFAGILLLRWSLYRALLVFGLIQALTNLFFIALAFVGKDTTLLATAVITDNFAAGMGSTALVAFFMRFVDKRYTATQFSVLVAVSTLPRILSGPIAAFLQHWFGWVGLYELSFLLALGFVPCLLLIRKQSNMVPIQSYIAL